MIDDPSQLARSTARIAGELLGLPLIEYPRAPRDGVWWYAPGASFVYPYEHLLVRDGCATMARNLADAYDPHRLT